MSDRFFIQNGGRNPKRTLYLKTPGGELIVCSAAQFQLDSSSNRDWFNMVPGDPQAGRAFLSCNKSKNERYLVNWPAAPELPDCPGMITRLAGQPPQFRFVAPDGCTASVRRYEGGQLRSLMAFDIPFDVTATVDTSG